MIIDWGHYENQNWSEGFVMEWQRNPKIKYHEQRQEIQELSVYSPGPKIPKSE